MLDDPFHHRQSVPSEVVTSLRKGLVDVLLEEIKGHLVAVFKLSVAFRVLLDRVVREVHKLVVRVFRVQLELRPARPKIALFEEVSFPRGADENPYADVELPFINQQRPFDVLLNNQRLSQAGVLATAARLQTVLCSGF